MQVGGLTLLFELSGKGRKRLETFVIFPFSASFRQGTTDELSLLVIQL